MTTDQIRIAVAECLGFTNITSDGRFGHRDDLCGTGRGRCSLLDYPNDLNACAEMEASLTAEEKEQYVYWLSHVCELGTYIFATALQRCEAFLRVKGKWQ